MKRTKDPKDLLLLALYAEFNKPCGDVRQVTPEALDMEPEVWLWSLLCLRVEGSVAGMEWVVPGTATPGEVLALYGDTLHLTQEGEAFARELTGTVE